ncbi:MAG: hypothetical protein ACYTEQ_10025 [Planctomycetota bacterium]
MGTRSSWLVKCVRLFGWLFLFVLLLQGCSTHRVNQFKNFADAGKSYAEAMIILTREAGNAAIDADSAILITSRDGMNPAQRKKAILNQTDDLRKLLKVMGDLRRHTLLLQRYFSALSRLAETDAPSGIGAEAADLAAALQGVSGRLADAQVGDAEVQEFIRDAVPLVVGHFAQKALETELRKNAATLERHLELQSAVLRALAEEMKADLDILLKHRMYADVVEPYVSARAQLPPNWSWQRRQVLSAYVSMASADSAAEAAQKLKKTFVALVEKKVEPGDFAALFADINAMIGLIELVQGTTQAD